MFDRTVAVVATSPRSEPSLGLTLAKLRSDGVERFAHRYVIGDGAIDGGDTDGFKVEILPGRTGIRRTFERALALTIEHDAAQLLFLEDDLRVASGALDRVAHVGVPKVCAFTAFFDARLPAETPAGLHAICGYFAHTQALLFPRRVIDYLRVVTASVDGFANNADTLLSFLIERSPWPYYAIHVPSLFQHVPVRSTSHPDRPLIPYSAHFVEDARRLGLAELTPFTADDVELGPGSRPWWRPIS